MIYNIFILLGRIGISWLYIWAASEKVVNYTATMRYMASKNVPLAFLLLPIVILVQLIGGLSVLLGFKLKIGAWILFVFTIIAAPIFHDYWNLEGMEKMTERTLFMKDMAILGSLLLLQVTGAGPISLERFSKN